MIYISVVSINIQGFEFVDVHKFVMSSLVYLSAFCNNVEKYVKDSISLKNGQMIRFYLKEMLFLFFYVIARYTMRWFFEMV